jgi:hypothetical protein
MIQADKNSAEFTITGGLGYAPITISGLTEYKGAKLEILAGEKWRSVTSRQCDYNAESGAWEITFSVNLDSPEDNPTPRQFRFSSAPASRNRQ